MGSVKGTRRGRGEGEDEWGQPPKQKLGGNVEGSGGGTGLPKGCQVGVAEKKEGREEGMLGREGGG